MKISPSVPTSAVLLGANGALVVSDTEAHVGSFYALRALTEVVIDEIVSDALTGSLDGITLGANVLFYLNNIQSVKLTSGTALLYYAE